MDAFQIAMRYLERRSRTEKELRDKLAQRKVEPDTIDVVIERLRGYGYINDQKFASDFQRVRDDYKPMGIFRLKQELSIKGVAKDITEGLSSDREKEYRLARTAAETRLRQYYPLEKEVFYRRMLNFLMRRGFDYATSQRVTSELLEARQNR